MGHLTAPLLQPRVVADLIGLSPASLRRWDAALLPRAGRRPRRYSWAEVEVLQRAVHQASGRGGTPAAFQGSRRIGPLRARRAATPGADGARRRNRPAKRRPAEGRGVVPVALPRSARRRDGQQRH
ncbi:MAG TPA: hypothetical protein VKW09_06525 [bacterium]|nr:hypothetical protein [bacterium]